MCQKKKTFLYFYKVDHALARASSNSFIKYQNSHETNGQGWLLKLIEQKSDALIGGGYI